MNMEFYFNVSYPSFPFPPLEKAVIPESPMQAVLDDTQTRHPPEDWLPLIRQRDPNHQYVVISVSHYKEQSPFPDFQHEYVVLFVQSTMSTPADQFQPTTPPIAIRVSRTIANRTLPARLGLWGPADDSVIILGSSTTVTLPNNSDRLHHLSWSIDCAPHLERISSFIFEVHRHMPNYRLLKSSCYAFARALSRSIHIRLNGISGSQQPHFLTRQSYFMHCIPAGITRAERVAQIVAISDLAHYGIGVDNFRAL